MQRLAKRILGVFQEDFVLYLKTPNKKSLRQQLRELNGLFRLYGFLPYQYLKHGLYLRSFQGDIDGLLPPELIHQFRDSVNPKQYWVNAIDKQQFVDIMTRANLPVVPILASITCQRRIVTLNRRDCSFEQLLSWLLETGHREIFLKPATSGSGMGAFKATVRHRNLLIDTQEIEEEALFALLFPDGRWSCYLVQPFIVQHPLLSSINPNSVNTVRIDTLMVGDDVFHNGAYLRASCGNSSVDSGSRGGLACKIDLNSGKLDSVVVVRWGIKRTGLTRSRLRRDTFRTHPVTGFKFEGVTVPYWDETKQLVCSAARAMLPLRSLGWDVAITAHGPILVETNHDYGVGPLQEMVQGLRDTPIGRETIAALRPLSGIEKLDASPN